MIQPHARLSSTLHRLLAAALAALSTAGAALAQAWVPNETQASVQPDLIDYEFSQVRGQFAWNDSLGNLWIGGVDRVTGLFVPADGRGILVDADSMTFQDAQKTKNGPEWVSTAFGEMILHTKYAGRHTDGNSRIGLAQENPDGTWTSSVLPPGATRKAPYGSAIPGDPVPRVTYVDNNQKHYWRLLFDPASEVAIPDFPDSNYPIRHVQCAVPGVPGSKAVAYPVTVGTVDQIFYREWGAAAPVQITADAGNKYEVWMWCAPEFDNELVFFTLVDQVEVRVYRRLPDANGNPAWTPILSHRAPGGNQIFSPEPFLWKGKSYLFMAQTVRPNKFRSEIWVANIDSLNPLFKRITPTEPLRTRTDPEIFVTDLGPMIYYNKLTPTLTDRGTYKSCRDPSCSEGVWFADPGLP